MLVLLAALVVACLCTDARAGVIHGRVALTREFTSASSVTRRQPGVGETVIFLEAVPGKVEQKLVGSHGWFIFRRAPAPAKPQRMVQADLRFKPRVLTAVAGQSVAFLNLDHVYHNVFSVSVARPFDLGKNAPGAADTVTFRRPGVVNVHCDIHPQETAFIVVVPNHALARPDSVGRFELPRLPEGHYTVRAWNPARGEIRRVVDVPRRGDVALDLAF